MILSDLSNLVFNSSIHLVSFKIARIASLFSLVVLVSLSNHFLNYLTNFQNLIFNLISLVLISLGPI